MLAELKERRENQKIIEVEKAEERVFLKKMDYEDRNVKYLPNQIETIQY